MKLSLVVIAYNIGDYIEDCLNSIVNQLNDDVELIIIDDGSIDHTADVVKKFIGTPNINYHVKTNGGPGSARNEGVKRAKGEYVWFIDGDDEITPNAIKDLQEYITVNPIFDLTMFYIYHKRLDETQLRIEADLKDLCELDTFRFIKEIGMFPTSVCVFLFNRSFLIQNDLFFRENMLFEDDHFMIRVFNEVSKINSIAKPFYIYKARAGSTMKSGVNYMKLDSTMLNIELTATLKSKNLPQYYIHDKLFFYVNKLLLDLEAVDSKIERNKYLQLVTTKVNQFKIFKENSRGIKVHKLIYNINKKIYRKYILKINV